MATEEDRIKSAERARGRVYPWHSGLTRDRPKVHLHLDGAVLWNDPDVDRAKPSDGEIPACIAVIKRCRDCLGDQLPTVPQRWKLL